MQLASKSFPGDAPCPGPPWRDPPAPPSGAPAHQAADITIIGEQLLNIALNSVEQVLDDLYSIC